MGDAEESFSLRQSSVQKAPSKSRSNYEKADGGKKGGGGGSGKIGLPQILAIVAIIITLIALVLAIYCALLWWFWPLVLAIPALTLAIVAIILAFVASSHIEAIIVCSALGIIFGFCGLVWGAVEIALCHSYQGHLRPTITYVNWLETADKIKDDYAKAEYFHSHAEETCKGRCYDWFYQKQILGSQAACLKATQDYVKEYFLTKGGDYSGKYGSCQFTQIGSGVDQYEASPIYRTHRDYYDGSRQVFAEGAKDDKSSREIELGKFCDKFDVTKFVEQREKCDAKLEKFGKFECRPDFATLVFKVKESKCEEIPKIKECKKEGIGYLDRHHQRLRQQDHPPNRGGPPPQKKGPDPQGGKDMEGGPKTKVYRHTKYIRAMGGNPICTDESSTPGELPPNKDWWGRCSSIIKV